MDYRGYNIIIIFIFLRRMKSTKKSKKTNKHIQTKYKNSNEEHQILTLRNYMANILNFNDHYLAYAGGRALVSVTSFLLDSITRRTSLRDVNTVNGLGVQVCYSIYTYWYIIWNIWSNVFRGLPKTTSCKFEVWVVYIGQQLCSRESYHLKLLLVGL